MRIVIIIVLAALIIGLVTTAMADNKLVDAEGDEGLDGYEEGNDGSDEGYTEDQLRKINERAITAEKERLARLIQEQKDRNPGISEAAAAANVLIQTGGRIGAERVAG